MTMTPEDGRTRLAAYSGDEPAEAAEAFALAADLLAAHPGSAAVAFAVACLNDRFGRERGAIPHYRRALALGLAAPDRLAAHVGLGSSLRASGDWQGALAAFAAGLAEYPGDGALRAFRALALHNLGRHGEALRELMDLALLPPDASLVRYARALGFYAGRPDEVFPDPG